MSRPPGNLTHLEGMIGEGEFIAWASQQRWHLYRGLDGHTPCDFVVDTGAELLKVEVKRTRQLYKYPGASKHYYATITKLHSQRFDFLFVSTPQGRYWIPAEECPISTLTITPGGKWEAWRV